MKILFPFVTHLQDIRLIKALHLNLTSVTPIRLVLISVGLLVLGYSVHRAFKKIDLRLLKRKRTKVHDLSLLGSSRKWLIDKALPQVLEFFIEIVVLGYVRQMSKGCQSLLRNCRSRARLFVESLGRGVLRFHSLDWKGYLPKKRVFRRSSEKEVYLFPVDPKEVGELIAIRQILQKKRALAAKAKSVTKPLASGKVRVEGLFTSQPKRSNLGVKARLRLKFFALGWVLNYNRSLLAKNQQLNLEIKELNLEIMSMVENWVPKVANPAPNVALKKGKAFADLRAPLAADFGLSIDFVESDVLAPLAQHPEGLFNQ